MNFRGGLFSEKEIQRMTSPERLDLLVPVTKPFGWWALGALALILCYLLIWAIFGWLRINVKGEGILINGGIKDVQVALEKGRTGRVVRLHVLPGAEVVEGQTVIAEIEILEEAAEYELKCRRRDELLVARDRGKVLDAEGRLKQKTALEKEADSLPTRIESLRELVHSKEAEVAQQRLNLQRGFITELTFNESRDRLRQTVEEYVKLSLRGPQISAELAKLEVDINQAATQREKEIQELEGDIRRLDAYLDDVAPGTNNGKRVLASASGRVLERKVDVANLVSDKTVLVSIEPQERKLEALVYVPAEEAKKIAVDKVGIPQTDRNRPLIARVNPSTVKPEEFGAMLGKVTAVQKFPATPEGMQQVLRNSALVQKLTEKGPPIEVRATMWPAKTPSGFRWSSSRGPAAPVVTGTLCKGSFEVERKHPISIVIPFIKKTVGLE